MSIPVLIEMAIQTVGSIGLYHAGTTLVGRFRKKKIASASETKYTEEKVKVKPNEFGAYLWKALYVKTITRDWANIATYQHEFRCPKCLSVKAKEHKLCIDVHYHIEHFDFKCERCGFECFLRSADDIDEKE